MDTIDEGLMGHTVGRGEMVTATEHYLQGAVGIRRRYCTGRIVIYLQAGQMILLGAYTMVELWTTDYCRWSSA